jgi:hypothetical protein
LKAPRGAKTVRIAHGSALLHRRGLATITLRLAGRVRRAIGHVHGNIRLTLTAVSSAPGTDPVTVTRSLVVQG